MKVYVASSFSLIPKVEKAVKALEKAGHEITVKWWARKYYVEGEGPVNTEVLKERFRDISSDEFYSKPETRYTFLSDLGGIEEAEAFIFVADDEPRRYNGANIELGYAYGNGLPCFSIGTLMNSALYHGVVRCENINNIIFNLKQMKIEEEELKKMKEELK